MSDNTTEATEPEEVSYVSFIHSPDENERKKGFFSKFWSRFGNKKDSGSFDGDVTVDVESDSDFDIPKGFYASGGENDDVPVPYGVSIPKLSYEERSMLVQLKTRRKDNPEENKMNETNCFNCNDYFMLAFKRRYHCECCGKYFCSNCTRHSISGFSLSLKDKKVKVCDFCFNLLSMPSFTNTPIQQYLTMITSADYEYGTIDDIDNDEVLFSRDHDISFADINQSLNIVYGRAKKKEKDEGRGEIRDRYEYDVEDYEGDYDLPLTVSLVRKDSKSLKLSLSNYFNDKSVVENPEQSSKLEKHIEDYRQTYFRKLLEQKQIELSDQWISKLMDVSNLAVNDLDPMMFNNFDIDVREYIKIKKILGGHFDESENVDGIVFSQNRTHKQMLSSFKKPRILLLGFPIEYTAGTGPLVSFDQLMNSEYLYFKKVLSTILATQPSIIFVRYGVSRRFQEELRDNNVTLIQNVKENIMSKLSRVTGAVIVKQLDKQFNFDPAVTGTCNSIEIRSYQYGHYKKSYVYVRGCPTELFSTAVLRGSLDDVLMTQLKYLFQYLCYVTHSTILETSYIKSKELACLNFSDQTKETKQIERTFQSYSPFVNYPLYTSRRSEKIFLSIVPSVAKYFNTPHLLHTSNYQHTRIDTSNDTLSNPLGVRFDYKSMTLEEDDHSLPHFLSGPYGQLTLIYLHALICTSTSSLCIPHEIHYVNFFQNNDMTLGSFLLELCFNKNYRCRSQNCNRSLIEHERTFIHHNGRINLNIFETEEFEDFESQDSIWHWIQCSKGSSKISRNPLPQDSLNISFGRYLELFFYGQNLTCSECNGNIFRDHSEYFYYNGKIAVFDYEEIKEMDVSIPFPYSGRDFSWKLDSVNYELSLREVNTLQDVINDVYSILSETLADIKSTAESFLVDEILPNLARLETNVQEEYQSLVYKVELLRDQDDLDVYMINSEYRKIYNAISSWSSSIDSIQDRLRRSLLRPIMPSTNHSTLKPTSRKSLKSSSNSIGLKFSSDIARSPSSILDNINGEKESDFQSDLLSLLFPDPDFFFLDPGVQNRVIPVFKMSEASMIAYTLNSYQYIEQVTNLSKEIKTMEDYATITCQFENPSNSISGKFKFECQTHFPILFQDLRNLMSVSDDEFIKSLAWNEFWKAEGGKSGAKFAKSLDNRWILKEVQQIEMNSFLEFAQNYFTYLDKVFSQQVPSALAKIVGAYTIVYERERIFIIILENLFYGRNITQSYDLKGSLRSRRSTTSTVLMDQNLIESMYENPFYVDNESKSVIAMTVWNDTVFLSNLNVMDYSLLVGIDEDSQEMVVGIIDYIRKYTWDKQLESWVKKSVLAGSQVPTIISPKQYKRRFRYAIWMYFLMVPQKSTKIMNNPGVITKRNI